MDGNDPNLDRGPRRSIQGWPSAVGPGHAPGSRPRHVAALLVALALVLSARAAQAGFIEDQLRRPRVAQARANTDAALRARSQELGLPYPPPRLFLRAFKQEGELEVWAAPTASAPYVLFKTYPICASSGELGPKRQRGDGQVPEGFYHLTAFNPASAFHLAILVDYPNSSDALLKTAKNAGGQIMVHGNCVTIGCIPITDERIEELYWLVVQVYGSTQRLVPIHIFPFRLSAEALARVAATLPAADGRPAFWRNLLPGYEAFERERVLPRYRIAKDGAYEFKRDGRWLR